MTNLDNIKQMNSEELINTIQQRMCSVCNSTSTDCQEFCKNQLQAWLEQEITPTLTDDEKVILRNIDKKYKWIARTQDDDLIAFEEEPFKDRDYNLWVSSKNDCVFQLFNGMFTFIKPHDTEPYEISKLLGGE